MIQTVRESKFSLQMGISAAAFGRPRAPNPNRLDHAGPVDVEETPTLRLPLAGATSLNQSFLIPFRTGTNPFRLDSPLWKAATGDRKTPGLFPPRTGGRRP